MADSYSCGMPSLAGIQEASALGSLLIRASIPREPCPLNSSEAIDFLAVPSLNVNTQKVWILVFKLGDTVFSPTADNGVPLPPLFTFKYFKLKKKNIDSLFIILCVAGWGLCATVPVLKVGE